MVDDIIDNPERGYIHPTAVKTSNGQGLFLLLVTKLRLLRAEIEKVHALENNGRKRGTPGWQNRERAT